MDFDGDGIPDILSGSWPGQLYFFKGLGKGKFAGKEVLKNRAGKALKIGSASTVFAVDWNGDGRLDLLIGDVNGRVHLMLNEGTSKEYAFGKSQELTADGTPIQAPHGDSHPIAVDWDGDKLLDLLVGCGDGSVLFYKNIGTAAEPRLAKAQTLVAAPKDGAGGGSAPRPGMRAKICAVDWNGDGRLDLLVGDFCQYQAKVEVPENERKAVEEARKRQEELMKGYREFSREYSEATSGPRKKETPAEAEARKAKLEELRDKYQDFMQAYQEDVATLAKLSKVAAPTAEQPKECTALRKKLEATQKTFAQMMQEVLLYQSGPFDEPPEKAKARLERLRSAITRQITLQVELAVLQEITRPYDASQMAGSVWLYLRQDGRTQK